MINSDKAYRKSVEDSCNKPFCRKSQFVTLKRCLNVKILKIISHSRYDNVKRKSSITHVKFSKEFLIDTLSRAVERDAS